MELPNYKKLETVLNSNELTTTVAVTVAMVTEMYSYVSVKRIIVIISSLVLSYWLVIFIRSRAPQFQHIRYYSTLAYYYFALFLILALSENSLSQLVFLGVMAAAINYFAATKRKYIWAYLPLTIVMLSAFFINGLASGGIYPWAPFISTIALVYLLIKFIIVLIQLNQNELEVQEQAVKVATLEHQRLLALVNNIGDAVIAFDEHGIIQVYNGAALELLNTNSSLQGKHIDSVWRIEDEDNQQISIFNEMKTLGTTIRRSDLSIVYDKNDAAHLYMNVTPIKIGYGSEAARGYTVILRDITKEKSLEEERDEFISVVSHELRTPITITEGKISNAQLLLSKKVSNKSKMEASLEEAHHQVVFLANMINDLSTLSRAERDDTRLELEPVKPAELVQSLVSSYAIEAKQHNLFISSHIQKQPIQPITTNRLYLEEILQNFITNALKYTRQGGITLSVVQVSKSQVEFTVADTGIGISTSDQKRVFDKFFRSEDFRTRENNGTGLGLYVTAKLASKIGATIKLKSKLNQGSKFIVTVPSLHENRRHTPRSLSAAT